MPASIKLQQQYGDDLQVLFVESQGASPEMAEAFAWRRRWMGTQAMWTTEAPLRVEGNTLPKFALLDTEGRLLLEGNPLGMKKQIEEAIARIKVRLETEPRIRAQAGEWLAAHSPAAPAAAAGNGERG